MALGEGGYNEGKGICVFIASHPPCTRPCVCVNDLAVRDLDPPVRALKHRIPCMPADHTPVVGCLC